MKVPLTLINQPSLLYKRLIDALTRNITFEDNIRCAQVAVADTGTANVEFTATHNLGKTPVGYTYRTDRAGTVYDSSVGSWTDKIIKLKCSTANSSIHLVIF